MIPLCSSKAYTTIMICATVFFLYADQNLLAPNLTAIAKDFGFTDEERDRMLGGYIAIGFFIVGGPIALVVGYFADFCNRALLFSLVVAFGESAGLATYWVQTYEQLFVCRVLTGISFGGATPIIFSMLGDLYSGKHRIYVSTFVGISLSAGVATGQLVSGMIGPWLGWRAPFLLIAVPALCCAFTIAFTVDEPRRGDQENAVRMLRSSQSSREHDTTRQDSWATVAVTNVVIESPLMRPIAGVSTISPTIEPTPILLQSNTETEDRENENDNIAYSEKIEWRKIMRMFSTPSVVLIFVQGFPGCIPWGMICVFLNDYLSEDRGMTVQAATAVITCYSIGGLVGQLVGGWLGQRLYNKDPRYQCLMMGITTLLAVFPLLYLIDANTVGDLGFFFMAVLGGFIVNMNGPNVRVVLQNVCIPEIRGTAFAVFTLSDDIGKGLGPALVVLLITACGGSRRKAFNIVVWFWLFCGTMLTCLMLTVVDDENRVQAHVKESMLKRNPMELIGGEESAERHKLESPSSHYRRIEDDLIVNV